MKKYRCIPCDWVYDPAIGDPENGIEAGVDFDNLPDDWACPLCGAGKEDFEEVEQKNDMKKRVLEHDSSTL